ncbi:MAG TPA: hypothetical protein VN660_12425 [Steroidobacteraceae bacterium]|nr:hypothetical protein [Steroidobacteraceae bacterium]
MPLPALILTAALATAGSAGSPDLAASSADTAAANLCHESHFVAYSSLPPGNRRAEESFTWDGAHSVYVVRGPILAQMFGDPGVRSIPADSTQAQQTVFQIAVRTTPSPPIDRFCEYHFQEMASCDAHGDITYTQTYTGCDLQTERHVLQLTPDTAGSVQLLEVRFADVRGVLSDPLYLSDGTDLRLRVQ